MTVLVTLEASAERRSPSTTAVQTTDGATLSWSDLFCQFRPALLSFARSRGASNPEDIVQEVFTTAVERFPRFQGDSAGLRSFLFTLTYRRVADEHRVTYRRREELVADHDVTAAHDIVTIEDSISHAESAREALQALEILGPRERRVIEMRILDEASPAQVAKALGISNGNVRVIQARALVKIRKYLEAKSGKSAGVFMPLGGSIVTFLKGLRDDLPSDGNLAEWIDVLHASSSLNTIEKVMGGAGSAIATGAAASSIAGTVLKVGLVIALATVSNSTQADGSIDGHSAGQDPSTAPVIETTESFQPANPPMVIDAPTSGVSVSAEGPQTNDLVTPSLVTSEESVEERSPSVSDLDETAETAEELAATMLADDTVVKPTEPVVEVVENVVDTVVDDVVDPLVDTTVEIVDDTMDTVETVVDEVDSTVDEVVEEVEETLDETVDEVDEVVEETVEEVEEVVEDLVGGLP